MTVRRLLSGGLKWVGGAVIAVVLLAGLAVGGIFGWMAIALPDYDGKARIEGLSARVVIARDAHAVPHIFADTMQDAYRALGYAHAQDRLLQMELNRRTGAGRLAEVMGAAALPIDRFMRTLGFYRLAEAQVDALPPPLRADLDAYVGGVNAYLADPARVLPPELLLLVGEPEPWRPADSYVWAKLMALQLSGNWRDELRNARLADRLTPEQLADLWPADPPGHAATLPDLAAAYRDLNLDRLAALADEFLPVASASNEWVVSGAHTTTGMPMLANDPHLGLTAPGLWYLARIVTPELTLTGVTVPGVPYHVLGHNGMVAWGFTTTHSDTQDLFVEKLDPADSGRYLTPDGALPFETREERIRVRFQDAPHITSVRATRHGPVISDIVGAASTAAGAGHVLAIAFPALAPGDRTPEALYHLNRARDVDEAAAALAEFHAPQQNIIYADRTGRIGFTASGQVPLRKSGNGMAPVAGWDGAADWMGFIPFDELPRAADPSRGRIVNANNRIVGDDYPYLIAADWPEPHRADRVVELIEDAGPLSVTDMTRIQTDTLSPAARILVPELLRLVGQPEGSQARAAVDLLARWDFHMATDQPQPPIFLAWLKLLSHRITADELGEQRMLRPLALLRMVRERPQWCDDVSTPTTETCADVAATSLADALALLSSRMGEDPVDWQWGALHKAHFHHALFDRVPLLRDVFDILIPTGGGPFTINRGVADLSDSAELFHHIHGPGYRAVYDLADLDGSLFMLATGQSGRPFSPFYDDLTRPWARGDYIKISGGRAELAAGGALWLELNPQ